MSFPIDTTIPNAPNNPADDQPKMQTNYANIKGFLSVDHVTPGTTNDGYHTIVHFNTQGSDPGTVANITQLYTKAVTVGPNTDQQLFMKTGAGFLAQLTNTTGFLAQQARFGAKASFSGTTGGWTFLPGGLVLNYGFVNSPVNGTTVAFAQPFTNNLLAVTLGGVTASTNDKTINIMDGSQSTSGFTIITSGTSAFTVLYYIAIGN